MTKATAWYYRFPADCGACGPVRFHTLQTEAEFRAWLRDFYKKVN